MLRVRSTEVQAFARWIERAEEALQASAQILRANQKWLGVFRVRFDQADGGRGGRAAKKSSSRDAIEFLAAVEFEHSPRIQ